MNGLALMIIFRVERVDKVGPYHSGLGTEAQSERNDPSERAHPLPHEDKGLKDFNIVSDYYFGFVSMEQLQNWWPKRKWKHYVDYNKQQSGVFRERIYGISEYEVAPEHVEVGDKQLVFRMSEAERLMHTPFTLECIKA